jgi:hypothetical protein
VGVVILGTSLADVVEQLGDGVLAGPGDARDGAHRRTLAQQMEDLGTLGRLKSVHNVVKAGYVTVLTVI